MLAFYEGIKEFFLRLWLSFIDFMEDFFLWLFDITLDLVVIIFTAFGHLFQALDVTQYISAIPPDVANIISLIGLGEAMGIILTAGTIRIVMQLIPFVRLGS